MSDKKKPETIFRTFRTIVIKTGEDEGVIDILIPMSTASTDRHGESIDPKGWKKSLKEFKKRSILLSSHNYGSLQNQIGELNNLQITEEGLFASPKYYINQGNPEADWAYFLASKGMAAFSVGFIPIKWVDSKDEPMRTYTEQELIEISQVTVPSNRDAIMGLQAKGIDDPVVKDIMDEVLITLKAKYDCSCIDCGYEISTDKHCKEVKCPKCGGTMRRVERPGPGEEGKLADSDESNKIAEDIKRKVLDTPVVIDPIDPEKVKASMEKDQKEDENILEVKGKIGYSLNDVYEIVKENKELKRVLADIELKAGAVLNTKNKANLKQAQALIQLVLDSAGTEEGLEEGDEKTKDTKKDDTVITITDIKKEDPPKDEEIKEKTITIDEKVIAEAIKKTLNYTLGITDK